MIIFSTILKLLGLLFNPIFIALLYDHRRNIPLAIKYMIGFILFLGFGIFLVLNYHIYGIIMAPIFVWGYFFIMFWESQVRKKKFENKEIIDQNN